MGDAARLFESAVDRLHAGGSGHLRFSAGDCRDVRCDKTVGAGKDGYPGVSDVFQAFKKKWAKASVLGLILGLVGLLLIVDFQIAAVYFHDQPVILSLFISLFIIYAIILLYAFPIDVHYDLKRSAVLKYSFIIGFSRPLTSFSC